MKKIIFIITFAIFLYYAHVVSADYRMVSSSASMPSNKLNEKEISNDLRVMRLRSFFKSKNSPLTNYAGSFIYWSDHYDLDWRLIPAITGVESGFGKHMPKNSFNAYGWANGNYKFSSWGNSIEQVSKTLREKYYDKGADDIVKIARRYAPPSVTWTGKVKYFMEKIDSTPIEFDL